MIGEVVRVTRIANDMSIIELAEKSNVSPSYISEIENGKKQPSKVILQKLNSVFYLIMEELLLLNRYYDSLVEKREHLEAYRLLLMKVLKMYTRHKPRIYQKSLDSYNLN